MPPITVVTESELRATLGFGRDELATVEAVYPLVSDGTASMPPIMRIDVPEHNGEVDIKSAYLPGWSGIAVKLSARFFDNPDKGLPSLGGLMVVLDATTGIPTAALFDNGFLTDLRTALAGAVAADHLARRDATHVGVVGAGVQARLQVRALTLVRDVTSVSVWARRGEAARQLAGELADALGVAATAVATPAEAAAADVLVTTTPATEPLVDAAMLHPGLHVTTIGSDAEHKQELAADAVMAADVFVCDHVGQSRRLGELRTADRLGIPAVVCLSDNVPDGKVAALQELGCEVVVGGESQARALAMADELATERGLVVVHPFDDPDVVAGQATVGLEVLEQASQLATVVVPLSDGGLLAGILVAVKTRRPDIRIVGVSMHDGAVMAASLAAGHPGRVA